MKTLLNAMIISFAMYSKIPMPRVEWSKENMKYSMCFFPAVGMVIGLLVTGWGWAGGHDAGFLYGCYDTDTGIRYRGTASGRPA